MNFDCRNIFLGFLFLRNGFINLGFLDRFCCFRIFSSDIFKHELFIGICRLFGYVFSNFFRFGFLCRSSSFGTFYNRFNRRGIVQFNVGTQFAFDGCHQLVEFLLGLGDFFILGLQLIVQAIDQGALFRKLFQAKKIP